MIDTNKELPIPADLPQTGQMAHPDAVKDFWLSVVKPAAQRGKLEKIKTVKAVSPRARDVARKQNAELTRAVFSGTASAAYRAGYDRIRWNHDRGPDGSAA